MQEGLALQGHYHVTGTEPSLEGRTCVPREKWVATGGLGSLEGTG